MDWKDPDKRREYMREYRRRRYATDSAFRERTIIQERARRRTPSVRSQTRARYLTRRSDPEYVELDRARNREYMRRKYATDPAFREARRQQIRTSSLKRYHERMHEPEYRYAKARSASARRTRNRLLKLGVLK